LSDKKLSLFVYLHIFARYEPATLPILTGRRLEDIPRYKDLEVNPGLFSCAQTRQGLYRGHMPYHVVFPNKCLGESAGFGVGF
jgi:hypothetical protein